MVVSLMKTESTGKVSLGFCLGAKDKGEDELSFEQVEFKLI